jgi:hypothetical protein
VAKHVEKFPDINKLCNVASCWIYEYTGILLVVHSILHISRIRVKLKEIQRLVALLECHGCVLVGNPDIFYVGPIGVNNWPLFFFFLLQSCVYTNL